MHYYKRNLGDYAKKAGRLSMLQHGAYTLLIDACYDREQFPTIEEAIDWTWASSSQEIEAVQFVLAKFFVLVDGRYVQKRIQEEIDAYHATSDTNKRIAAEREAKRKSALTERARSVNEAPPNQEPLTINQEPKEETSKLSLASTRPLAESETEQEQAVPGKPALPDCPHLEILSLWAEVLPALPQHSPSLWNGARASHLRARWRETAATKGWTTKEQGLAYFMRVFQHVGKSKFLTGRVPNRDPTKRPFLIELEWLVSPGNWAKVLEGKYSEEVAAA